MTKKLLMLVLAFTLVLPLANAFAVSFQNLNNSIFPDERASYSMTISNDKGYENNFQISTRDPSYVLSVEPPLTTIPSLTTQSYTVYIKPKQGVGVGPHAVPVKVKSITSGQFKEDNLLVNIKPRTPFGGEYAPAVNLQVDMDSPVDPRSKVPVKVNMNNKNPRDMPELQVMVDGEIFSKSYQVHLNPLESKTSELLFTPDPLTEPGVYTLDVKLVLQNNITIAQVTKDFEVIEYSEVKEDVIEDTNFFKITRDYELTNFGNVEETVRKRIQVPWYQKLFTSFNPQPETAEYRGEEYYQWSKELGPNETLEVRHVQNYRIPVFVLFAIIIAVIAYYYFRSPVVVQKTAFSVDTEEDSTVIKVRLVVRNRSKDAVKNVTILDKIPSMADFIKETEVGTLKPEKVVKSSSKGTSLRYEMPRLESYEERIITYKMKCKLQIVGGMNLPQSKAKFETEKGKERASYSNSVTVTEEEF